MKNKDLEKIFLSDSYNNQIKQYNNQLKLKKDTNWDIIVISASNANQASRYELEIQKRIQHNLIPKSCNYYVFSDPDGKRVGSGGATLNIISELTKIDAQIFNKKILLIHSGGDSKRIPQYSVTGKLFSPIPRKNSDNNYSTIFDELMSIYSGISTRMDSGIFITCGDILPIFNSLQIDFQYKDCSIISMKESVNVGVNHGVICADSNGLVTKFLHKYNSEMLIKEEAVNRGLVDLDIGSVYLSSKVVKDLYNITKDNKELLINDETRLNFYGDFLYPMCLNSTKEQYLEEKGEIELNNNIAKARTIIWKVLSKYNLTISRLSPAEFIHFGTTKEFFSFMNVDKYRKKYFNWNKTINSIVDNFSKGTFINSIVTNSVIKGNCYVENSIINDSKIGSNSIICNCEIKNMEIYDGIVLSTEKINNGYITRFYSIEDNPKDLLKNSNLFCKIDDSVLIDKNIPLWDSNLYIIEKTNYQSVKSAIEIIKAIKDNRINELNNWLTKKRISLKESFNISIFNDDLNSISEEVRKLDLLNKIKQGNDIKSLVQAKNNREYDSKIVEYFFSQANKESYEIKNRIYYFLFLLTNNFEYYQLIFENIKKEVNDCFFIKFDEHSYMNTKQQVIVENPLRVNFGGAWTDTPPYCIEKGGKVLNYAILINNSFPVKVVINRINTKEIKVNMKDINLSTVFNNIKSIQLCNEPNDPFALIKAALNVTGIVNKNDNNIDDCLKRIGTGFEIITDVKNIPRGSGLGTSSILSGTLIEALLNFFNINHTNDDIYKLVLLLEQKMSTGGGWQDQVGGLTKGVKLIEQKANSNKFNIKEVRLNDYQIKEINNRVLIINSGQRRLARNLLREMVLKYINGGKEYLELYKKIEQTAEKQKDALISNDIDLFGKLCTSYWDTFKKLEPECTNIFIEYIFDVLDKYICGKTICGAGGGGFIIVVLKKEYKKQDIEKELEEKFPDSQVKVWNSSICEV